MASFLLAILYLSFIALGVHAPILGSAWPVMSGAMNVPLSYLSFLTVTINVATIGANICNYKLAKKLSMRWVVAAGVAMIAASLFLYASAAAFWQLCLISVLYGFGVGSVDTSVNTYMALHYESRYLGWLHACWGVGATIGPCVMSWSLRGGGAWGDGFAAIAWTQVAMTAVIFAAFPLWKQQKHRDRATVTKQEKLNLRQSLRLSGAKPVLIAFLCFAAFETICGQWASSYIVLKKGIDAQIAARWVSYYYLGVTVGRVLTGFFPNRMGDKNMIRFGLAVAGVGLIALQFSSRAMTLGGLVMVGLGCAPIFPALLHETPETFGDRNAKHMMGIQLAFSKLGAVTLPPLLGLLLERADAGVFPFFLLALLIVVLAMTERANFARKGARRA